MSDNQVDVLSVLKTIEARLTRIEKRLFEPMSEVQPVVSGLSVIRAAEYPDDRELEKRMRQAAAGKELQNGVMRREGDVRLP